MNKEKYITSLVAISILGFTLLVALPKTVHAVDTTTNTTTSQTKNSTESTTQATRIQNLKSRADTEITKRLTALNALATKVQALTKLSTEQKGTFSSDIQSNITSLTTLKSKIDTDTDPTTLQSDVKSIVDGYRIFALYVPKIHLLAGADAATQAATNLSTLAIKLQAQITSEQQSGKDTASLTAKLTDMNTNLVDASTKANSMTAAVVLLTPSGYPGNITDLKNAEQMLKAVKTDLQTAKNDAQQIINDLKSLEK